MTQNSTPASLLERLSRDGDDVAWTSFVQLYTPFIFYVARRFGLSPEDAADIVQDVFMILAQRMSGFEYDPTKGFRAFLRTITENRIRRVASRRKIRQVQWPESSESLNAGESVDHAAIYSEDEYRQFTVSRALQLMKAEFSHTTWQACWEHMVSGKSAAEIGDELGMSEGAVYAAKTRVLRRLRSELRGLWD